VATVAARRAEAICRVAGRSAGTGSGSGRRVAEFWSGCSGVAAITAGEGNRTAATTIAATGLDARSCARGSGSGTPAGGVPRRTAKTRRAPAKRPATPAVRRDTEGADLPAVAGKAPGRA